MSELSCTTENAVRNTKAFKDAYNKAKRAAVRGIVTDVLGEEWTKKQFEAISWPAVLRMHGLDGAIDIPGLDEMRYRYGWVEYCVEEFELPEAAKQRIAANNVAVTFEDGSTETFSVRPWRTLTVGGIWWNKRIVKVEEAWPDFKGRRYVYRFV